MRRIKTGIDKGKWYRKIPFLVSLLKIVSDKQSKLEEKNMGASVAQR